MDLNFDKSDEHYADIRSGGMVEPIVIMENVAESMINHRIPTVAVINVVLALKHILRAGTKTSEGWRKELQKGINYLNRAVTGEWME